MLRAMVCLAFSKTKVTCPRCKEETWAYDHHDSKCERCGAIIKAPN